ncbi:unnamed protein product [Nippostrongylus brasiliensis]|uniref:Putative tbp-1 interacting protein (inferred by orthology to a S. mansoni protein) n=1 Tax=Nippostrongylus brasiliensis TaxID=27835 RepID=A0A0N4Y9B1_NIPBR|nr:hypothetical protein Q1695_014651 [Nippostrongylus brasiliensis]VDL76469.1 unnamed protein product [Nippostrongylus brasiliensis]
MSKADLEHRASKKITEYMIEQNRPYSVVDVCTNLRQEFGKALVLKVLEASVASGVLKDKLIGKQKIFYANQDKLEKYDEKAIEECDSKIELLSEKLRLLSNEAKSIQTELKELENAETTAKLKSLTSELQQKIKNMKVRISKLEVSRDPLCAQQAKEAFRAQSAMMKVVQSRKRIATDMINAIMENSPLSKRELLDSMGVEMDVAQ